MTGAEPDRQATWREFLAQPAIARASGAARQVTGLRDLIDAQAVGGVGYFGAGPKAAGHGATDFRLFMPAAKDAARDDGAFRSGLRPQFPEGHVAAVGLGGDSDMPTGSRGMVLPVVGPGPRCQVALGASCYPAGPR